MELEEIKCCIQNYETIIDETRLDFWYFNIKFAHLSSLFLAIGFCVKALRLKSPECQNGPFGFIAPPTTHPTLCNPSKKLGQKFKGPLQATQQKLGCGCSQLTEDTGEFINHVFIKHISSFSLPPSPAQHLWEHKRSTENTHTEAAHTPWKARPWLRKQPKGGRRQEITKSYIVWLKHKGQ